MQDKKTAGDGTLRREDVSDYISTPNDLGFKSFTNTVLTTLSPADFEAIIINDDKWADLKAQMDADFENELEMFPYEEKKEVQHLGYVNWIERYSITLGNALKKLVRALKISGLDLPRRYNTIYRSELERRFPGGHQRGADIGDGDIRDMLSDLKIVFKDNLAKYILWKRGLQLGRFLLFLIPTAICLILQSQLHDYLKSQVAATMDHFNFTPMPGIFDKWYLPAQELIFFIIAALYLGIVVVMYEYRSKTICNSYNNSQNTSCSKVDKQASLRTNKLANLIFTFRARIDSDQTNLLAANQSKDWPDRAGRWMVLIYWLSRRLEALESYSQIQVWLIRRAHYYYSICGNLLLGLTFLFSTVILVATGMLSRFLMKTGPSDSVLILAFMSLSIFALAYITIRSATGWNTSLRLIQENLGVENWDSAKNVKLHELLAKQVSGDKLFIMQREGWFSGRH